VILVTGATGCLGANLVERLAPERPVRVLVRDEGKLRSMLGDVPVEVALADLTDRQIVLEAAAGADTILHTAVMNYGAPGFSASRSAEVNRTAMRNVLDAAHQTGAHVIFSSSQSAYGVPVRSPIDEDHPLAGHGPYSASKVECEGMAMAAYRERGVPVTILRLPGFHGRHLTQPSMLKQLGRVVAGKMLAIPRTESLWDFAHADDMVAGFRAAIANPRAHGLAINLPGSGPIVPVDYFRTWAEVSGSGARVFQVPRATVAIAALLIAEVKEHRYFFDHDILMDGTRAQEVLGYRAALDYPTGIERTLSWMRSRA
jgi:nucleoside-diphosphate-sugar epimerase